MYQKKSYFLVLSKEVRYPSALGIMTSHRGMLMGKAFFHPMINILHVKQGYAMRFANKSYTSILAVGAKYSFVRTLLPEPKVHGQLISMDVYTECNGPGQKINKFQFEPRNHQDHPPVLSSMPS